MKFRKVLASTMLAALMALGSAPAAHAGGPRQDNDIATAIGGNGGNGGAAVAIGVCAIQVAVVGDAGCANNGVADASGGDGGNATATADEN
ncbi:MAG: hypothetical protein ACRDZO_06960 [Egibacteraceae bacterium]